MGAELSPDHDALDESGASPEPTRPEEAAAVEQAGGGKRRPPLAVDRARRLGWLLLAFPLLGIGELQAFWLQRSRAVSIDDYTHAATAAAATLAAEDTVVFAPRWTEQLGRQAFGRALGDERMNPADLQKFHHVLEISAARGEHAEVSEWPVVWQKPLGKLTLRMRENPRYRPLTDDLTPRVGTERLQVSQGEHPCKMQRGTANGGAWGLPTPAVRYACNGGVVGTAVIPDLDHQLRRCLLVPATPTPTRLHFTDVSFGRTLRFSHGLHTEGERERKGPPIQLRVFVQNERDDGQVVEVELARETHQDGEGFRAFEVDTEKLAGQTGDLYLEASAAKARPHYCLEGFAR